jgi:hypothetical protein
MAKKNLLIIARRVPMTYQTTLKQTFAGDVDIDVVVDRRHRHRRRRFVAPTEGDRRVAERRLLSINAVLRQLGWVLVEQSR